MQCRRERGGQIPENCSDDRHASSQTIQWTRYVDLFFVSMSITILSLVRSLDDYTAQKIRQIESKYPAITTPTEDVVNSFNEKTEPVRNVMNSVKDTTTSTIQHGKETVRNFTHLPAC